MSATLSAVPVEGLTSGNQLFRCEPYNCTMLARACVERQAKAELGLEAITLLKCKGCALGAQVRARATDVSFTERELLKGARGSGHHRGGVLGKKLRGARNNPDPDAAPEARLGPRRALPIIGLNFTPAPVPAELPPAFTTKPPPASAAVATVQREIEGPMPRSIDVNSLIGKEMAGVKIVRALPSEGAGQLARVRFPCGHEDNMLAFLLNSYVKNGQTRLCKVCKSAKPPKAPRSEKPAVPPPAPRAKERKPAPRKGAKARPAPLPPPVLSVSSESKAYEFPLRRDFGATVTLPTNLTMYDVERFTRWMETLVFEDAVAAE